jgi:uncharacterized protein involved in response to NO
MRIRPDLHPPVQVPGPILLARGFRPFFLLAGVYAVVLVGAWVALFRGWVVFPTGNSPVFWHGHEMLFGYAVAAMSGFLLTATPHWTDTPPLHGRALLALVGLWLAGRVAVWLGALLPLPVVAVLDLAYLPAFGAVMTRVIWPARKPKNFIFIGLIALLCVANLHSYLPLLGSRENLGLWVAVDTFAALVVIVGGRVVPSFTQGVLRLRQQAPALRAWPWLDQTAVFSTIAVALADLFSLPAPAVGALALLAGIANVARLAGYRSAHTVRVPILWSLHAGYAWTALGLCLKGLSAFVPAIPISAALHALTVGGIGTMTLAIMSRAALGHTGRVLTASTPIAWAYGLISAAALIRMAVPMFWPALYLEGISVSGGLWVLAFLLFVIVYAPILTGPREDGVPG